MSEKKSSMSEKKSSMSEKKPSIKYSPDHSECVLNSGTLSMGKSELRQAFLPLVSELQAHPKVVEITDRDRPVAVLLSYQHYTVLQALAKKAMTAGVHKKVSIIGSVEILGDFEAASKEIAAEWEQAVERSAAEL
jgi:prevent-host-death family protein